MEDRERCQNNVKTDFRVGPPRYEYFKLIELTQDHVQQRSSGIAALSRRVLAPESEDGRCNWLRVVFNGGLWYYRC
jgi:hypothetical protein